MLGAMFMNKRYYSLQGLKLAPIGTVIVVSNNPSIPKADRMIKTAIGWHYFDGGEKDDLAFQAESVIECYSSLIDVSEGYDA